MILGRNDAIPGELELSPIVLDRIPGSFVLPLMFLVAADLDLQDKD